MDKVFIVTSGCYSDYLKLFAAKRSGGYCGGLIVVAANNIDEAYQTYIDWVEETGNSHLLYDTYEYGDTCTEAYNEYPRENWYEIEGVKVLCDVPQVIDEAGYTE